MGEGAVWGPALAPTPGSAHPGSKRAGAVSVCCPPPGPRLPRCSLTTPSTPRPLPLSPRPPHQQHLPAVYAALQAPARLAFALLGPRRWAGLETAFGLSALGHRWGALVMGGGWGALAAAAWRVGRQTRPLQN